MIDNVITYDVAGRTLNFVKLMKEIRESGAVAGFSGAPQRGGVLYIQGAALQNQAALDVIVRDHVAVTLDEAKAARISVLGGEISAFILSRYPQLTQLSLLMLMAEGNSKGLATRRIEIQKGIDWIKDCLVEFYSARTEVLAATTIDAVKAVALDTTVVATTDPLLDLETIMGLGS